MGSKHRHTHTHICTHSNGELINGDPEKPDMMRAKIFKKSSLNHLVKYFRENKS